MLQLPAPEKLESIEGHYLMTFGPHVLDGKENISLSIGQTVANTAEAERQLEGILRMILPGHQKELGILLSDFRGHKKLAVVISRILEAQENLILSATFSPILKYLHAIFETRDRLAHGIFCSIDAMQDKVLLWSLKNLSKYEQSVITNIGDFDHNRIEDNFEDFLCELWADEDFSAIAKCSRALVHSLYGFQSCISATPHEVNWLHEALRSQGLLPAPPWKLQHSTPQ